MRNISHGVSMLGNESIQYTRSPLHGGVPNENGLLRRDDTAADVGQRRGVRFSPGADSHPCVRAAAHVEGGLSCEETSRRSPQREEITPYSSAALWL